MHENGVKMKKATLSILLFIMIAVFGGCSQKEPLRQGAVFVVWKTPVMKYADQGFLYENDEELKLEIYSSGQAALSLTIDSDEICSGLLCMSKKEFNARYLSPSYPETMIEKILTGSEIIQAENKSRIEGGFEQKIERDGLYSIHYIVKHDTVFFDDKLNRITIKINKTERI